MIVICLQGQKKKENMQYMAPTSKTRVGFVELLNIVGGAGNSLLLKETPIPRRLRVRQDCSKTK